MVFSRIQLKGKFPKVLPPKFQKAVKQQKVNESNNVSKYCFVVDAFLVWLYTCFFLFFICSSYLCFNQTWIENRRNISCEMFWKRTFFISRLLMTTSNTFLVFYKSGHLKKENYNNWCFFYFPYKIKWLFFIL